MANILYLVHRLPYPPNKGDKVRSYHLVMKGLAFLTVGAFMFVLLIQKGAHRSLVIEDLAGAARKYPLAALALSIALLAL